MFWVTAAGYGDPHLITLDGVRYSYSGLGEYVLLQTNNGNDLMAQVLYFAATFLYFETLVLKFICAITHLCPGN